MRRLKPLFIFLHKCYCQTRLATPAGRREASGVLVFAMHQHPFAPSLSPLRQGWGPWLYASFSLRTISALCQFFFSRFKHGAWGILVSTYTLLLENTLTFPPPLLSQGLQVSCEVLVPSRPCHWLNDRQTQVHDYGITNSGKIDRGFGLITTLTLLPSGLLVPHSELTMLALSEATVPTLLTSRASRMARWVECLSRKPDDLSSVPAALEGVNHRVVLWPPHPRGGLATHTNKIV